LATVLLAADLLATGFFGGDFLAATGLPSAFLAAGLAVTGFFATTGLALDAGFFGDKDLAADLGAAFTGAAFLAGALTAAFATVFALAFAGAVVFLAGILIVSFVVYRKTVAGDVIPALAG